MTPSGVPDPFIYRDGAAYRGEGVVTDLRAAVEGLRKSDTWPQFGPLADGRTAARAAHNMALDEVEDLLPEGAVLVTEEELARAIFAVGDRVGMSREKYAAAILRHLRETP